MSLHELYIGVRNSLGFFMKKKICAYHQDHKSDWVAELECGHFQHVRHNPPWVNRPWVATEQGRKSKIGFELECRKCNQGAPKDAVVKI